MRVCCLSSSLPFLLFCDSLELLQMFLTHADAEPSAQLSSSTGPNEHTSPYTRGACAGWCVNAIMTNANMNSKFILCYLLVTVWHIISFWHDIYIWPTQTQIIKHPFPTFWNLSACSFTQLLDICMFTIHFYHSFMDFCGETFFQLSKKQIIPCCTSFSANMLVSEVQCISSCMTLLAWSWTRQQVTDTSSTFSPDDLHTDII